MTDEEAQSDNWLRQREERAKDLQRAWLSLRDAALALQQFYVGHDIEVRARALYRDRHQPYDESAMDRPVIKGIPMQDAGGTAIMGDIVPAWGMYVSAVFEHDRIAAMWAKDDD